MKSRFSHVALFVVFGLFVFIGGLSPTVAFAGSYVDGAEYYSVISEEAAKHGITCTPNDFDFSKVYSRESLDRQVSELQAFPIGGLELRLESEDVSRSVLDSLPARSPMPVSKTYTTTWTVWPHAFMVANIVLEVKATINAQNDSVMSINSCRTYASGTNISFQSWRQESANAWYTSTRIYAKASGTASFRDQVGIGYEAPIVINHNWAI